MEDIAGVVVAGASGRMGQMLIRTIAEDAHLKLVGALERAGSDWIGRDAGEAAGIGETGVRITDDAVAAIAGCQVLIDFTQPQATVSYAELTAQARAVHVIGTTGLSEEDEAAIARTARHTAVIRAGNMSRGVNLLVSMVRQVARALGPEFDVEVVEAHHSRKVDAPSGTALMLGAAAAEGRGQALASLRTPAREGITGTREEGAIGFSAIRGGDIVGEHDVIFAGPGERIVLRHVATDRAIFARGAVAAAHWGHGRAPGLYDMSDVLGIE